MGENLIFLACKLKYNLPIVMYNDKNLFEPVFEVEESGFSLTYSLPLTQGFCDSLERDMNMYLSNPLPYQFYMSHFIFIRLLVTESQLPIA